MSGLIYIAIGAAGDCSDIQYPDESVKDGFVTMKKVRIIKYGQR